MTSQRKFSLGGGILHVCSDGLGLGHGLVFDQSPVVEQVLHANALHQLQVIGHETTVTAPPHRLRTHDRGRVLLRNGFEFCDPRSELGTRHVIRVGRELIVAPCSVRRAR